MSAAPQTMQTGTARARVMVVDDSVVVRGLLARWLQESGCFDVVATAANGRLGVDALARVDPELVVLDLEMPEMDGLTALPLILRARPGIKVMVVSTLTKRNAEVSLKCLSLGAVDYLGKPEGHRHVTTSTSFRQEFVTRLKALASSRGRTLRPVLPLAATPPLRGSRCPPRCLVIGASTGGPRAVEEVLLGLGSAVQRIPVMVVQHMPSSFTGVFAEHLRTHVGVRACEPDDREPLVPGTVYVAPGGRHMGLSVSLGDPVVRLDDGPPVNFCRPAVDVLFRDAAAIFGSATIAVVLTGMGQDGTEGTRLLAGVNATIVAQDEATSIIWGMPGSVVKAGLTQNVLPLEAIGRALRHHVAGLTR